VEGGVCEVCVGLELGVAVVVINGEGEGEVG
jgi:hypothetical protein